MIEFIIGNDKKNCKKLRKNCKKIAKIAISVFRPADRNFGRNVSADFDRNFGFGRTLSLTEKKYFLKSIVFVNSLVKTLLSQNFCKIV